MAYQRRNMLVQLDHPMSQTFLFILFLVSFIISTNIHACNNQTERNTLLSFALTLSSPTLNWTTVNCCDWEGITCNQDGLVTHLRLPSKVLKLKAGKFLASLGNLTHLSHLNLSHNSLYGSLDQTGLFLPFNRLEILDLSYNLLSGGLPFSLPSSNIRTVDFSSNHLHGAIPSSFFQHAWSLTSFNVSNNTFTGSIPSSICLHYSSLIRQLDFSNNKFSGNISPGLGKCSKLQVFRAGHNNLSGILPKDMYNATTLEEITLPANSLYGAISENIVNLTNLVVLDLGFNQLSGVLPLHFGKLSKLKLMLLHFNDLEGCLPQSLMNCTNLVELHMGTNNLNGDISTLNFSKLSRLTKLDLRKNNFTGMLPISLYSCKSLKAIRLSLNNLDGQIQPQILSLKSLSFLSLGGGNRLTNLTRAMHILMRCKSLVFLSLPNNFLGEEMPVDDMTGFDGFKNLRILDLSGSELTGQIPVWLSKLKKLEILNLNSNRIRGPIPSWLGTLPRLFTINLAYNLISGEFPKELCKLPRLISDHQTVVPVDPYSYLELPIYVIVPNSEELRQYNYLFRFPPTIYLNNNSISGNISNEIGQLKLLHRLDLNFNNFSGNIPDQISNLKNMEFLDLSMNHLSGKIPTSLASLNFLSYLNVSYNNLQGPIPTSSQLQSFNASVFEGNPKLCGAPLPNECRSFNGIDRSQDVNNGHQIPGLYICVALGFITGFWGVCGSLMLKKTWRYAYFQFLQNVQNRLYVMISVRIIKMKRSLARS